MKTKLLLAFLLSAGLSLAQDTEPTPIRVTHGPILGRPASNSMSLWVRTNRPGEVQVFYGVEKKKLGQITTFSTSGPEHDHTGILTINGLKSNTRYYYRVSDHQLSGSFRTLPQAKDFNNLPELLI